MTHSATWWLGVLMLGLVAGVRASVLPDEIFPANFEAPPDCVPLGTLGCPGFIVATPQIQVTAGTADTFCYYFRTPNTASIGVGRFTSRFDAVVEHIVVYATYSNVTQQPADTQPPGTVATGCGFLSNANGTYARRIYSAHEPVEQLRMPADDGAGQPVALELPANSAGFIEMHVVNASVNPANFLVEWQAHGLATGAAYTKTATFMTYKTLTIPAGNEYQTSDACAVPASVKFWWFSTHTHKYATFAELRNGVAPIVQTSDWESPAIATYAAPSFYQFGPTDKLTYACTYLNNTGGQIHDGDDNDIDENCVGVGYFFPADAAHVCVNSFPL